jgi:hypothetical protein
MSTAKAKKIVLLLGILIAFLIGINVYANASILKDKTGKDTLSLFEKIRSSLDLELIRNHIKK